MATIELATRNTTDKLKVVVESRNRPVRVTEYVTSSILFSGCIGCRVRRKAVISELALDLDQARIIQKARAIADKLGIGIEIIDLGKQNAIRRLVRRLTRRVRAPSVHFPERTVRRFEMEQVLYRINAMRNSLEERLDLLHKQIRPSPAFRML
ncbi:MAG: hypothetical protein M1587_07795 [Thaumarchaeota archaeon]|nr:hypothetical protein [Nitrososphaerota archaeon]